MKEKIKRILKETPIIEKYIRLLKNNRKLKTT